MITRSNKVRLAIYLALGFLLLRLLYAFLFGGLWGERILLNLPSISLSRPFSHITLLGDISLDGIIRNLEIGLPFAIGILIFGVLSSLVSQRQLLRLSEKVPPVRNLLTALALGLGTVPALIDASKKVAFAKKLRGEKRLQILVPMFERAVELANSLALRVSLSSKPNPYRAGVDLTDLRVSGLELGPVNLRVQPGEVCVLSGATGSGKTSILEAIAGVSAEYRGRDVHAKGTIAGLAFQTGLARLSETIGFIPQNPRELTVGLTTEDLLEQLAIDLRERLGLQFGVERSIDTLSEGEVFKLVFGAVLSRKPTVLVLDEPFDALDKESRLTVSALLQQFASEGNSVILSEHEPAGLSFENFSQLQIGPQGLTGGVYQPLAPANRRTASLVGSDLVFRAEIPETGFDQPLIARSTIELYQGECVWLSGANGSGKTTLLEQLVLSETATVHGLTPGAKNVVLVPESFDDFFVTDTLTGELNRADKIAKAPRGFTQNTLESILPSERIAQQLNVHPRDLSRGTRLALAISMQLSHKPQVLLLDEPFRGLDPRAKELISESLRCVQETGCAILFASHERLWAQSLATRRLEIVERELREIQAVEA